MVDLNLASGFLDSSEFGRLKAPNSLFLNTDETNKLKSDTFIYDESLVINLNIM